MEKILRVQPDVKKIYLPVRAVDAAAAKDRVETEVVLSIMVLHDLDLYCSHDSFDPFA